MENRAASRTYGSLDDQTKSRSSSTELLSAQARESLLEQVGPSDDAPQSSRGYGRRPWMTAGLISVMAVGTVMFMNRSWSTPALMPGGAVPGSLDTIVEDAGRASADKSPKAQEDKLPKAAQPAHQATPKVSTPRPATTTTADAELSFSVTNFYHTRDGKPGAMIPWLDGVHLAEPYRDTTITVGNPRDGHEYLWEVREKDGPDKVLASSTGSETNIVFTVLDWNTVTITETNSAGGVTRQFTDDVMVKYVRREIRTLTDDERTELLDSMAVLWDVRVQGGQGKEIYGDDYADIWAINRLHFTAAGGYYCDHFHDGLGFLTSHSMMTNTFEFSLQVVNPKLTVPYWDFTIESSTFGGNAVDIIEPQDNSPLFSADWFGRHDPDDLMLKDSRWGYTEIPKMKVNNPGNVDADVYSKLRAPWNVNDRAYLARSMGTMCGVRVEEKYPWPNCQSHYDLTTSYTDFYSWVWDSLYDPHGPVHVWLGGVMDCDETYDKVASLVGKEISAELAYYSFVHRKNLFRSGFFSCSASAQVDETPDMVMKSGKCGCLAYNLEDGDDYKAILNSMVFVSDYIGDFSEDIQRSVTATLCNGIANDGDHLQASSSLDPSFWVTHPTMERLWMFKRLTGTMTDLTWPDEDTNVLDPETGSTTYEVLSLYDEDCDGHRGEDIFPFGLAIDDGDVGFKARTGIKGDELGGNTLTNREILQALDPRVNKMSYIYDTFEWEHCDMDGIHMSDTWDAEATEAKKNSKAKPLKKRPTFKEGEVRYPLFDNFRKRAQEIESKKQSPRL